MTKPLSTREQLARSDLGRQLPDVADQLASLSDSVSGACCYCFTGFGNYHEPTCPVKASANLQSTS